MRQSMGEAIAVFVQKDTEDYRVFFTGTHTYAMFSVLA